jgi:hypothetical protein
MADILRKGIAHPKDLRYDHLQKMLQHGLISGHVTEKTDGAGMEVGHDDEGFYVRSSRSPKVREAGGFEKGAREKYGDDLDPTMSRHYDNMFRLFDGNKNLKNYLKQKREESGKEASVKGEIFYKPFATPAEDGGVKFVGTSYDPNKMGKSGSFIMHSQMDGNEIHDPEHFKTLGNEHLNFDHDVVENGKVSVPAKDLKEKLDTINPEILGSRKKEHSEQKAIEQQKVADINSEVEKRIRAHTDNLEPKWGNETEGHVFHPDDPEAQRVKVTSPTFQKFKAAQAILRSIGKK